MASQMRVAAAFGASASASSGGRRLLEPAEGQPLAQRQRRSGTVRYGAGAGAGPGRIRLDHAVTEALAANVITLSSSIPDACRAAGQDYTRYRKAVRAAVTDMEESGQASQLRAAHATVHAAQTAAAMTAAMTAVAAVHVREPLEYETDYLSVSCVKFPAQLTTAKELKGYIVDLI